MTGAPNEVLAEAFRLRVEAGQAYREGRLRRTARGLSRAAQMASVAGEPGQDMEDECRFWLGAALHGQGKLREALAAWAPLVHREAGGPLGDHGYMALTRYLLVAIDLPLELHGIERAFEEVEDRLRASPGGADRRRSRLLLARTRLALYRGRWGEALELAREGAQRRHREWPSYTYSAHYRPLVRACLRTGELDLIPGYLREWDERERAYPFSKHLLMSAARIDHLLASADATAALAEARRIETAIYACEEPDFQTEAGGAFIRACLATGRARLARPILARLMRHRHSALGQVRFATRLLLTDVQLARVQSDHEGPHAPSAISKASRALERARREADRLDRLLACERHAAETEDRDRSLAKRRSGPATC